MGSEHIYSDGPNEWFVERLWEQAAGLPVSERFKRALESDLNFPVILSAEGDLMDGCHRLVQAWLQGLPVRVVQFTKTPTPHRYRRDHPQK